MYGYTINQNVCFLSLLHSSKHPTLPEVWRRSTPVTCLSYGGRYISFYASISSPSAKQMLFLATLIGLDISAGCRDITLTLVTAHSAIVGIRAPSEQPPLSGGVLGTASHWLWAAGNSPSLGVGCWKQSLLCYQQLETACHSHRAVGNSLFIVVSYWEQPLINCDCGLPGTAPSQL